MNEIIEKAIPEKIEEFLTGRDEESPDYNELISW